jgi:hypothetical protein
MASELTPEYIDSLRRTSGEQKLRTAFALYWAARRLKAAAFRNQHPDWTEEEVQKKVRDVFLRTST